MSFLKNIFKSKRKKKTKLEFDSSNIIDINPLDLNKVNLNIQGKNNKIEIKNFSEEMLSKIEISIYGDNCSVFIDENFYISYGVHILLGLNHKNYAKINNTHLKIGKNTTIESARIITFNSNNTISVGDECMLSENVMLHNTDSHPIYNKETGEIINYVHDMTIGNSCWLGMNVKILKNSFIADNCIIGADSIITKKFTEQNCILAGVPAKVVRRNIDWKRSDIKWVNGEIC